MILQWSAQCLLIAVVTTIGRSAVLVICHMLNDVDNPVNFLWYRVRWVITSMLPTTWRRLPSLFHTTSPSTAAHPLPHHSGLFLAYKMHSQCEARLWTLYCLLPLSSHVPFVRMRVVSSTEVHSCVFNGIFFSIFKFWTNSQESEQIGITTDEDLEPADVRKIIQFPSRYWTCITDYTQLYKFTGHPGIYTSSRHAFPGSLPNCTSSWNAYIIWDAFGIA